MVKDSKSGRMSPVEIITAEDVELKEPPVLTVRTGMTGGKTFHVKINEPRGRALLIAVHL